MSWASVEQSIQNSAPVELYTFTSPALVFRLTSYEVDFTFGSQVYSAVPTARSSFSSVVATNDAGDFTVEVPATHALAKYYASGIPPRELKCAVARYQPSSGTAMTLGQGYVTALSFGGRFASFRVSGAADAMRVSLPTVSVMSTCNHNLYDERCTVVALGFRVATTIQSISPDRRTVVVATMGNFGAGGVATPDDWAKYGELVDVGTTERRTISTQVGRTLTLSIKLPPTVAVGSSVYVFAGCNHSPDDCFVKFSNMVNYGGLPQLPFNNPYYVDIRYYSS